MRLFGKPPGGYQDWMSEVRINRRFHGPPDSGNGGYSAGLVATALGGSDCTVTLWKPPPLDRPMTLKRDGDSVELSFEDERIATGQMDDLNIAVPPPPDFESALAAQTRFAGLCNHIFPACFVCGPQRTEGDGLRIFPGRLDPQAETVAATWLPDESLGDEDGIARSEFLWAALDCPGYFAVQERAGMALLGRLGARLMRPVRAGEPLIVTGWPMGSEGRRHRAGTALHDRRGDLVAAAEAVWVTLKPSADG